MIPATKEDHGPGKSVRPYPKKKPKAKMGRGVAQVVEHLFNKHEILSSNSNITLPPKKHLFSSCMETYNC
jgi:hypothetical protein